MHDLEDERKPSNVNRQAAENAKRETKNFSAIPAYAAVRALCRESITCQQKSV
jgi:hypothetical protein